MRFTEADHALVIAAVADAELKSDGEIVTIVARQSDSYHDVGLHYAVLAMLFVPAILAFVPPAWIEARLHPLLGWNGTLTVGHLMLLVLVKQIILFLIVRYGLTYMPLRIALTPGATRSRRVRRRAVDLFRASAERRTTGRTGILLYLSLLEHRAEIVADEAIHSKVELEIWGEAMTVLIAEVKAGRPGAGMAAAVERIGIVLAQHLPRSHDDTNELPDRLIEL